LRENAKEKEVDPCEMMMDTTMFDETNPMMEWLNEDEEHMIMDGAEAATTVFEKIRSLNSRKKASHLGRNDTSRKGRGQWKKMRMKRLSTLTLRMMTMMAKVIVQVNLVEEIQVKLKRMDQTKSKTRLR
jgi:hypothetical protein